MTKIITASEAAELLGVTKQRVSKLISLGRLEPQGEGVTEESVIAYRDTPKPKGGRPLGSRALKPKWMVVDKWGKPIANCYFPSDAKALAETNPNYSIKEKPPK